MVHLLGFTFFMGLMLSRLLGFPLSYADVEYLLLAKPNLGKGSMRLESFRPTQAGATATFLDREKRMIHLELNGASRLTEARYYQSTMHAGCLRRRPSCCSVVQARVRASSASTGHASSATRAPCLTSP